ncbi:MAG: 50S ribosomal protein L33 [Erysipelothrix sp.]|nr:50S ribosomal protein L33 [Erysipelothrix sp.]
MRTKITFRCAECKEENYIGTRNKSKQPERMKIQKFCPKCNKMTEHNEKR